MMALGSLGAHAGCSASPLLFQALEEAVGQLRWGGGVVSRGCLLKCSPEVSRLPVALMVLGQCGSPNGTQPGRTEAWGASAWRLCWMKSERKTRFTDSEGDVGVHRCSSVCALLWTHLERCGRHCDMLLFVSGSLWAALGVGGGSQPWPQKRAQKCLIKG